MKLRVRNTFLEADNDAGEKSRRATAGPILGGFFTSLLDDTLETDVGSCAGSGTESSLSAWDRTFSYNSIDRDLVEECDGFGSNSATVADIARLAAMRAAQVHSDSIWGNDDIYSMYLNPYQGFGWQPPYYGNGHMPEFPGDGDGLPEWGMAWPYHTQLTSEPVRLRQLGKTTERSKQWSANKASSQTTEEEQTTVMLRNLPNDYTRDMLITLLESQGFSGCFDFVYLPFDFKKHAGLGYAFMNMIDHKEAVRAMRDLPGFKDWKLKSNKVLQVTWSTPLQGLAANIERYRNSPVMHPDVPEQFKPLLLKAGHALPFPPPTKALQAPVLPNM
jgi:hypothetical protein